MQTNKFSWLYHTISFLILSGIILIGVSWLHLCSETCNAAHHYRILGMPFEVIGALFFAALAVIHLLSYKNSSWVVWGAGLTAAAIGTEIYFIFLQKYVIGAWCPVCLTIAGVIALLGLCYLTLIYKGGVMFRGLQKSALIGMFLVGFGVAFFGVSKIDQLEAVENAIKEKIKFGNPNSEVEVYVFTDWSCPACRAAEPAIEAMAPAIMKKAQLTFVDTVVHPETLNYAPYNLSFAAYSKPQYFKLREALTKLSTTTKKPTDEQVSKIAKALGVTYRELPYQDVSTAMKYFDDLVDKLKVTATPTVAIVNRQAKKGKKLSGAQEITESNVLKAIESIQ